MTVATDEALTRSAARARSVGATRNRLADGAISRSDAVEEVLSAVQRTAGLHAYVALDEEGARAEAARQDRDDDRRALSGIAIGVKDLIVADGFDTRAGSASWSAGPVREADIVTRVREAGAIVLGKQATHEFGYGMNSPQTRNPRDPLLYAGGSTVGGAVSVAVGSSRAAIGTDGGGSIRKPAAINGLVGFKPTFGLVPTAGLVPGVSVCDHPGWITVDVPDSLLLLQVITGQAPLPSRSDLRGVRLGRVGYFFRDLAAEVEADVAAALQRLRQRGAEIVDLEIPELSEAAAAHGAIVSAAAFRAHAGVPDDVRAGYDPGTAEFLAGAAQVGRAEEAAALAARARVRAAVDDAFTAHGLDAMVSPTLALGPIPLSEFDPGTHLPQYCRLTMPLNLTGHPAVSVPCGTDEQPVGLQLIGPMWADAELLQLAALVDA